MRELQSEIIIEASPERVWSILMDFERYPEWNPFVSRLSGTPQEGQTLSLRLTPPGGMAISFKPTVTKVVPEREFSWLGHLLVTGLFDGEHAFELYPEAHGSLRFVQSERFNGLLVAPLLFMAKKSTLRGFEAMNQALKQRAESEHA